MFMAGADGRTPELRPSEFKGMMRFWWRAIRAENDIENLKREEAEIFGGSGEGQGKSKIRIRVYPQPNNNSHGNNLKNDYNLNWAFDRNTKSLVGNHAGIGYLLYSTVLPRNEKSYIKPNFNFSIELSSFDEKAFKQALASLWASIYLGGFGTRARRGGGNLTVEEADTDILNFVLKGENSDEIANWIIQNFQNAKKLIKSNNTWAFSYSNLSFSRFIISKNSFNSWQEALNNIGKIYLDFRKSHKNQIFDTAVFGLPVMHQGFKIEGGNSNRRASPLVIKILSTNNRYWCMALRLFGEFLPKEEVLTKKIRERNKWQSKETQKPDYSLIDEFWRVLKSNGQEFILNKPDYLDKIVDKIKQQINPQKIILFGSRVRGDAHKGVDIDIAIESEESLGRLSIDGPFDIVNFKKVSPDMRIKIEREGVALYERKS
jgi:CRISPR-associated protein Cmr1